VPKSPLCIDGCVQIWPDADFARIPEAGIAGFLVTAFEPYADLAQALRQLLYWHTVAARHPEQLCVPSSASDVVAAHGRGASALILGCQGLNWIGDQLWPLDAAQRLGLRVAQLTYNDRNMVGDGCLEDGDAGLSRFGRRVVAELDRLGLTMDLSHVGERTSLEAAQLASRPVLFSHANPRVVVPGPRNITDEQIRACAATGGVVGVTPWGPMAWRRPEAGRPVLDDFLACLEHVVDLVGPEHVAIGTDMSFGTYDTGLHAELAERYPSVFDAYGQAVTGDANSPLRYVAGFDTFTAFPAFGQVLVERGYSPAAVAGILGGNYLRVLESTWL